MNYDIPKSTQTQKFIEISASPSSSYKKTHDPFHEPAHEADNFGGQFITASGTVSSSASPSLPLSYSASPSAPPDEYIYFISENSVIPQIEMERQHMGHNMELVVEISNKK